MTTVTLTFDLVLRNCHGQKGFVQVCHLIEYGGSRCGSNVVIVETVPKKSIANKPTNKQTNKHTYKPTDEVI